MNSSVFKLPFDIRPLVFWLEIRTDFSPYSIRPSSSQPAHKSTALSSPSFSLSNWTQFSLLHWCSFPGKALFLPHLLQWKVSKSKDTEGHLFSDYSGLLASLSLAFHHLNVAHLTCQISLLWLQDHWCLRPPSAPLTPVFWEPVPAPLPQHRSYVLGNPDFLPLIVSFFLHSHSMAVTNIYLWMTVSFHRWPVLHMWCQGGVATTPLCQMPQAERFLSSILTCFVYPG